MAPKTSSPPKNWPTNITYLSSPTYCKSLTPTHKAALKTKPQDPLLLPETSKGPCPLVKITPISSPDHPANGQYGLFATRDLKPGTFILRYLGDIHVSSSAGEGENEIGRGGDEHASSDYDLSLDRELGIGVDADRKGNEARFINDYRGVRERANAEFREGWDERAGERGMGVWVLGEGRNGGGKGRGVRKGEEILVSYGRGFWGARKGGGEEGGGE